MAEITFPGLNGSNLLAYLAALGVLRTWPAARLSWRLDGNWRPTLHGAFPEDPAEFAAELWQRLQQKSWPSLIEEQDDSNKIAPGAFRQAAEESMIRAHAQQSRDWADWLACLGCDGILQDNAVADTAFRTMSGAGHQHFLKTFRDLHLVTNAQHLEESLFREWTYADGKPGLRFDPAEDRRYALRWNEPSTDPVRTVRGANRLAVEALPLFPATPLGTRLETTGFTGRGAKDTWFAWPLWTTPLSLDSLRSLLAHPYLYDPKKRANLFSLGVPEVYRVRRLTLGKMRNFTPSTPLGDSPI